jgi:hypothetical protein
MNLASVQAGCLEPTGFLSAQPLLYVVEILANAGNPWITGLSGGVPRQFHGTARPEVSQASPRNAGAVAFLGYL